MLILTTKKRIFFTYWAGRTRFKTCRAIAR